jgi:hypothetical protein
MWYKVDWDRLVLLLLPTFLRKPNLFGYIKALLSPVDSLHYNWKLMREANLNKLSYNGQKCYLRKALNDIADFELRRIYINEVPVLDPNYLYQPEENLDFYLDTMFLDLDYSEQGETVDFVVYVPTDVLELKENEIIATLEFYTLAGKTYKILTI